MQVPPGDLLWICAATFRRLLRCDPAILVGLVLCDIVSVRIMPLMGDSPSAAAEWS
jgi:hypothetical protein